MSVLELRDLSVEVAGLPILEGLSLALRRGDKAGVVGRNGAGKTSLLEVIAGRRPPLAGSAVVRGRLGYLRQDPRQHAATEWHDGLTHVLEARGLPDMAERLERHRRAIDERPSDANVARFSRLEERYRAAGGYSAEAEVRRIANGSGWRPIASTFPSPPSPAASAGAWSSCGSCSRVRMRFCSTSPRTTWTATRSTGSCASSPRTPARSWS
jgi:ATPase subunit of ABC transporter with duplicated ATPase domains